MSMRALLFGAALLLLTAAPSAAQSVKLQFIDGLVNLSAQNVPVRVILAEWARLGGTTIVNGDKVTGAPVTIELVGATERYALDVILREVPGYMLAARAGAGTGASRFDRLMIVPTTTAPRPAPATTFSQAPPPAFTQRPNNAALDQPDDVGDVQRVEQEAQRLAQAAERARETVEALRRAAEQNRPGFVNPTVTARPAPPPFVDGDPAARQAPPPPAPVPGNPFVTLPGSPTPGTIAPIPQQPQTRPADR